METLIQVRPILNEADYDAALIRMNELWDAPRGTPDGEEGNILFLMTHQYEEKHYLIKPMDPIEHIRHQMEERGLKQKDLIGKIGTKSRVSEVLNYKKKLTLDMIRVLSVFLDIPFRLLAKDYPPKNQS